MTAFATLTNTALRFEGQTTPDYSAEEAAEIQADEAGYLAAQWETDPDAIYSALQSGLADDNADAGVEMLARLIAQYRLEGNHAHAYQVLGAFLSCLTDKLGRMAVEEVDRQRKLRQEP